MQQANALVQASAQALSIGGWALAAALLAVLPISTFFAINAGSFFLSALLIARIRAPRRRAQPSEETGLRERLRRSPAAARRSPSGVIALGVAVTISAGTWIGGVPTLVRDHLHDGAGAFSIVMVGYAAGAIVSGALLARRPVRRKALASLARLDALPPAYGLIALGGSLWVAVAGAFTAALRAELGVRPAHLGGAGGASPTRRSAGCSG